MLALVLVFPAMMGATVVLNRQVVTDCSVAQGEVGVRSPVTSAEEVGGLHHLICHMMDLKVVLHCCTMWYNSSYISCVETFTGIGTPCDMQSS